MRSTPAVVSQLVNFVTGGRVKFGWWSSRYQSTAAPIIIGGTPRSGTTLLRAMLDAHPQVWIGPENGVFQEAGQNLAGMEACLGLSEAELARLRRQSSCLGEFVDRAMTAALARQGKATWGLKSPPVVHELATVLRFFPRSRFIHTLRDGRDAVCSLRTHPKYRTENGRRVPTGIVNPWPDCVRTWVTDTKAGLRWRGSPWYIEVKYEDLVEAPEHAIRRIAQFLDLPFDAAMLRHYERPLDEGVDSPHPEASRAVYRTAVTRWRTDLGDEGRAAFTDEARQLLIDLGYERSFDWPELASDASSNRL